MGEISVVTVPEFTLSVGFCRLLRKNCGQVIDFVFFFDEWGSLPIRDVPGTSQKTNMWRLHFKWVDW